MLERQYPFFKGEFVTASQIS